VAETFVELADTLVERFDRFELLHVLATRCVELLTVDAAVILLADEQGALELTATSGERVRPLGNFVLQGAEEDPAAECFHSGQSVRCDDLRVEPRRWPRFSGAAIELGFAAVDAVPMRLRDEVIGALALFRTSPGALPPEAAALAQSFANVATISLLRVRAFRQNQVLAQQLQDALTSRITIEQAKGVLTERLQIGVEDAFSLMLDYAHNTNQPLSDVADQVNSRSPQLSGMTRLDQPRRRWQLLAHQRADEVGVEVEHVDQPGDHHRQPHQPGARDHAQPAALVQRHLPQDHQNGETGRTEVAHLAEVGDQVAGGPQVRDETVVQPRAVRPVDLTVHGDHDRVGRDR
jgi:hypothetical protein